MMGSGGVYSRGNREEESNPSRPKSRKRVFGVDEYDVYLGDIIK